MFDSLPSSNSYSAQHEIVLTDNDNMASDTFSPCHVEHEPHGGDIWDCLSASDIDRVLLTTLPSALSAFNFFHFRNGALSSSEFLRMIDTKLITHGKAIAPLHIRHHWVLLVCSRSSTQDLLGRIYDSAPSHAVRSDIKKILAPLMHLAFEVTPRQLRFSNECGVFAVCNALRIHSSLPVSTPPLPTTISLSHARSLLLKPEQLVAFARSPTYPALSGGDWAGEIANHEIDNTLCQLGIPAIQSTFSVSPDVGLSQWHAARRSNDVVGVPIWVPRHWIGASTRGDEIFFFDSAPKPENLQPLLEAQEKLLPGGRGFVVTAPVQPPGSSQCGLHVIANITLFAFGISLDISQFPNIDLDSLRTGITSIAEICSCIFQHTMAPHLPSSLSINAQCVVYENNTWAVVHISSRRRGMTLAKGWIMEAPKRPVEFIWREADSPNLVVLNPPRIRPLSRPQIPAMTGNIHPQVAPHYQVIAEVEHERTREENNVISSMGSQMDLLSSDVIAFLSTAPINSGFHFSSEGMFPPPHTYKIRDIKGLTIVPNAAIPSLAKAALAASTTNQHRQILSTLKDIDVDLDGLSLDIGMVEWLTRLATRRGWKGSTLQTRMAATAGAFRLLPIYAPSHAPIILGQSTIWAQAARASHKRALLQPVKRAAPASWNDVQAILESFPSSEAAFLIFLAYCACARIGDVCRLRREDLNISDEGIIVTFKNAKTTMKRGAFSVPASLPQASPLSTALVSFLNNARGFIFKKTAYAETRILLRTRNLTQHSVRRGAIHRLAASGMAGRDIIRFTGHSSVEALVAYLDDGALDPDIIRGLRDGQVLFGGGSVAHVDSMPFSPSTAEICRAFPTIKMPEERSALHIKEVGHMDLTKLERLPCMDDGVAQFLSDALRWVRDPTLYRSLIPPDADLSEPRISPLSDELMEILLNAKCELTAAPPIAEVFPFAVSELKSCPVSGEIYQRRRPIFEPRVNSIIKDTGNIFLTSLEDNISGARHGKGASIQLDFVSSFDQIPLEALVKVFFGRRWKDAYYVLKSLPMGLRTAVLVACSILWFLLSFPKSKAVANSFVDNVRFCGPPEDVITATLTFVERCDAVGATLDKMPRTRAEAALLIEDEGDFLGAHFHYKKQEISLTEKTRLKIEILRASEACRNEISFQQFAVIMGLFNYAARVTNYPLFKSFHLFRRYRNEATYQALFPPKVWGSHSLTLSTAELSELASMETSFLTNNPRSILAPPPQDVTIFSDACATGWGGVMVWRDGSVDTVNGKWDPEDIASGKYDFSAKSEPAGLIEVWKHCAKKGFAHAQIWLDHEPLVWAFESGRPHSWEYNKTLAVIAESDALATVGFVPGQSNPADYPSRGAPIPTTIWSGLVDLCETLKVKKNCERPAFMM